MTFHDTATAGRLPLMPTPALVGRNAERVQLERLLERARMGRSEVLVLRGERGIGKTALLDHAALRVDGFRVIRMRGIESEMELPFAGLHLLCTAMGDCMSRLQPVEREVLEAAIGFGRAQPDRFMVGLATAALLSSAAAEQLLLCVIDDAQWLDRRSAQALAFAARRLESQPVAMLLAERDPQTVQEFDDLPELRLTGLSPVGGRELLRSVIRGRADEAVVGRIIAETRGNPLALLELLDGASTAEFAGGFGAVTAVRPGGRVAEQIVAGMEDLPADSRRALLLAAADATGDPALQWRAAAHLGLTAGAFESEAVLRLSPQVTFCDPSLRSAIYCTASNEERRLVHAALAAATDPDGEADWRTWHLAHAVVGGDEELAGELQRCVPAARERGGAAAAAAFLEKAAMLSLDSVRRSERALAAAAAKAEAGAPDAAARLLALAEMGPLNPASRIFLQRQRARIAFATKRGNDAAGLLLRTARQLEPLDPGVAGETFLEAMAAAIFAGRLGDGTAAAARAICASLPRAQPVGAVELLLRGLVARFTEGYPAAYPILKQALDAFRADSTSEESSRWTWLASRVAADLWEDEAWRALATLELQLAEDGDAQVMLPYALTSRAVVDVHGGEFGRAAALVANADATAAAMGHPPFAYTSLILAAWRGQETRALELLEAARQDATERGEGVTLTTASYATAVLYNSLGRYEAALAAAGDAAEHDELGLFGWSLVELVEAAARSGRPAAGVDALEELAERARVTGTDWAIGVAARSRALLSDSSVAEGFYTEAIERLQRSGMRVHVARARLVYGEWLRRQGRRIDARRQLRDAQESFVAMGAEAFAKRAHRELLATGETVRRRAVEAPGQLTPQETRIAFLARDGLTNPAIGERLFVSPRTVEYHLHKVFEKFGITSRRELHLVLGDTVSLSA